MFVWCLFFFIRILYMFLQGNWSSDFCCLYLVPYPSQMRSPRVDETWGFFFCSGLAHAYAQGDRRLAFVTGSRTSQIGSASCRERERVPRVAGAIRIKYIIGIGRRTIYGGESE